MRRLFLFSACALVLVTAGAAAVAQAPPPHYPGTVCYTPAFWCWSPRPCRVGDKCACPSPKGWIGGVLG